MSKTSPSFHATQSYPGFDLFKKRKYILDSIIFNSVVVEFPRISVMKFGVPGGKPI